MLHKLICSEESESVESILTALREFADTVEESRIKREAKTWHGLTKADRVLNTEFTEALKTLITKYK